MTAPAKKPYHKKRHPWKNQDLRSDIKRAAEPRFSETPCPRCMALAQDHKIRPETVQRMPEGLGVAPIAQDGSGKCCFDCGFADGLVARKLGMDFEMARIAVGNDRQEQYRLPGAPMGLVQQGLRKNKPGDLDEQHKWLDRMDWFGIDAEQTP